MGVINMPIELQEISTHLIYSHQFMVLPIPRKSLNTQSTAATDVKARAVVMG
jgi:hypothetical protein